MYMYNHVKKNVFSVLNIVIINFVTYAVLETKKVCVQCTVTVRIEV